jgi:nucleoside-diphosphate-sugar epimerase
MRVAITGATGFLGSHLAQVLAARGVDVVGVVRDPAKGAWLESERIALRKADLADPEALADAFSGVDAVVANAALAAGWARPSDREFLDANVVGTANTLAAARAAGVRRVVYVSTIAVYQTRAFRPMDEDHPQIDPDRPAWALSHLTTDPRYARTKAAAERTAWAAAAEGDLALTALRPGPIYGPRDGKLTARYGRWMARPVAFAPTAGIPHVHAADVARAAAAALETPASIGQAYNLGGASVSPYRVLVAWRRHAGGGARVVPVPTPVSVRVDDRRAARTLGFAPCPIEDGIAGCVAWFGEVGAGG